MHWDRFRYDAFEELGMTRMANGVYATLGEGEVN
jgi:hypothetical protein